MTFVELGGAIGRNVPESGGALMGGGGGEGAEEERGCLRTTEEPLCGHCEGFGVELGHRVEAKLSMQPCVAASKVCEYQGLVGHRLGLVRGSIAGKLEQVTPRCRSLGVSKVG